MENTHNSADKFNIIRYCDYSRFSTQETAYLQVIHKLIALNFHTKINGINGDLTKLFGPYLKIVTLYRNEASLKMLVYLLRMVERRVVGYYLKDVLEMLLLYRGVLA